MQHARRVVQEVLSYAIARKIVFREAGHSRGDKNKVMLIIYYIILLIIVVITIIEKKLKGGK